MSTEYCNRICDPVDGDRVPQRGVDYGKLAEQYPAHEFVIDVAEAESLGFHVTEASDRLEELFAEEDVALESSQLFVGFVPKCVAAEDGRDGQE